MDSGKLGLAVRNMSRKITDSLAMDDVDPDASTVLLKLSYDELKDCAELIAVLSRVVAGSKIDKAFGSPGDWGYGTAIGDALASRG
ncbi:MAG: hypothetical protein WA003_08655 [Desulfuromonadaceae bacterium]